jgi:hypothetical protein
MAEVITALPLSGHAQQPRTAKYWAFISYSQRDLRWGQWLIRALEAYRIPKQLIGKETTDGVVPTRLAPVFRDRDELSGAADLGEKIREAVEQSRALIVICSPNSAHSEWVNKEVIAFKSSGRGSRVLTFIVDGEPNTADAKRECFPPAVRYRVNESGVVTAEAAEPLAADARDEGDGKRNALLKLIAGVLNVDYDALRRRDHERRIRRFWIAGGVVALAAVTFLGLAIYANQERMAVVEASAARARELISYVWTDLGATREGQIRFASLTEKLASAEAKLGQPPTNPTADLPEIAQPDGFDCKTKIAAGFRYLYCLVRNVISVPKLEAIAERRIFLPDGPHSKGLNLADESRFGHYDERFLDWLDGYLIPADAGNVRANVTKLVYESYIGPTARALYRTHEVLFADPAKYQAFVQDYAALKKQFFQKNGGIGSFESNPTPFADIRAAYQARLAQPAAERTKDQRGATSNGLFFEERFKWLSDYVFRKYHTQRQCCEPWYLASNSAGFWVRRSIDGTEAKIFTLVKKVLATFEPTVLAGNRPSNWRTVEEDKSGAPASSNARAEARPTALPTSSSSIVPATSEMASSASDRAQSPPAEQPATQDGPQTAVAAPALQPSGEKASPTPTELAQPLVAREAGPRSSPRPSLLEASAKGSPAPAPVFGNPGDSGEHKPGTPEPRGEAEFAAPTALSAPGLPPVGTTTASAPPSASADLANIGEHQAATPEGPKDPRPRPAHHPQHITHAASQGNTRASTGNTTAHLNQQELARHRSVAETPDNGILGYFRSLFH